MRANDSARRMPKRMLAAGALLAVVCCVAAAFEAVNPIAAPQYVAWRGVEEARRLAIESKRPILFAVFATGTRESTLLERDLFGDPALAQRVNREFVPVRLDDLRNGGRRNAATVDALLARFGAVGPALIVSSPDGDRFESVSTRRGPRHAIAMLTAVARNVQQVETKSPRAAEAEEYVAALSRVGSASMPSFSPDGQRIAFIADVSGVPQVWIVDRDGGWPEPVTRIEGGAGAALWSPDGKWIAFASPAIGGSATQIYVVRPDGSGVRRLTGGTADRNLMGWWTPDGRLSIGTMRRTTTRMECALVDPDEGAATIVDTTEGFGLVVDVSRDGRRALVSRRDGAVRSLALAGLAPRTASRPVLPPARDDVVFGRFAPDGKSIFAATNHRRDKTAFATISLEPSRFGTTTLLWSRDDAEVSAFDVDGAARRAALIWNRDGFDELALLELATGARRTIALPCPTLGSPVFSPDGRTLALTASGARSPSDVWLVDVQSGRAHRLTRSAHAGVDLARLAAPRLIRFRGEDGLPLTAWLWQASPRPGPLVISLHGGPLQQERAFLSPQYHALVASGISVLAPNIRGSAGFGRRFATLDDRGLRFDAIRDVKAAADQMVRSGIADPQRLGIMGESYGGWLTVTMLTRHPRLFAAAVDQYGMIDLERGDAALSTVAQMQHDEWGDPHRDAALLRELSPRASLDRIVTPTLVLHGARDGVVEPWHSDTLVKALRARRVPVDYLVLADEGHGFRREDNRVRATLAITNWFVQHLAPRAAASG